MRDHRQKVGAERFTPVGLRALLLAIVLPAAGLYALFSHFPYDYEVSASVKILKLENYSGKGATEAHYQRLTEPDFVRELNDTVRMRLTESGDSEFRQDPDGSWFFPWLSSLRRFSIELGWDSGGDVLFVVARSNLEALTLRGAAIALEELTESIDRKTERALQARLEVLEAEIFRQRARVSELEAEIVEFERAHQQTLDSTLSQVARVQARFHDLNPRIGQLQDILARLQDVSSVREFREIETLSELVSEGHPILQVKESLLALDSGEPGQADWEHPAMQSRFKDLLSELARQLRRLRNEMIEERQRLLAMLSEFRTGPEVSRQLNRLNRSLIEELRLLDELESHRGELTRSVRAVPETASEAQLPEVARRTALFSPLQRIVMALAGGLLVAFLMHFAAEARTASGKPVSSG